jgi:flagellar basal-body rod modification protein FlgD
MSSTAALSSPATTGTSSSGSAPTAVQNLASQNVFLQLLVAQLKNQDPSQPTDGTQFVTELAQFSTLQEDTTTATDLNKIVAALPGLTASVPSAAATHGTANPINQ